MSAETGLKRGLLVGFAILIVFSLGFFGWYSCTNQGVPVAAPASVAEAESTTEASAPALSVTPIAPVAAPPVAPPAVIPPAPTFTTVKVVDGDRAWNLTRGLCGGDRIAAMKAFRELNPGDPSNLAVGQEIRLPTDCKKTDAVAPVAAPRNAVAKKSTPRTAKPRRVNETDGRDTNAPGGAKPPPAPTEVAPVVASVPPAPPAPTPPAEENLFVAAEYKADCSQDIPSDDLQADVWLKKCGNDFWRKGKTAARTPATPPAAQPPAAAAIHPYRPPPSEVANNLYMPSCKGDGYLFPAKAEEADQWLDLQAKWLEACEGKLAAPSGDPAALKAELIAAYKEQLRFMFARLWMQDEQDNAKRAIVALSIPGPMEPEVLTVFGSPRSVGELRYLWYKRAFENRGFFTYVKDPDVAEGAPPPAPPPAEGEETSARSE